MSNVYVTDGIAKIGVKLMTDFYEKCEDEKLQDVLRHTK